jgi:hypothetical protein
VPEFALSNSHQVFSQNKVDFVFTPSQSPPQQPNQNKVIPDNIGSRNLILTKLDKI